MASEKVIRILRQKGAPFSYEEMQEITDAQGWAWIYGNKSASERKPKNEVREICFTGVTMGEREMLEPIAMQMGFTVKSSVTKSLEILVTGLTPGPMKIKKAQEQGCQVMDVVAFLEMVKLLLPSDGDTAL